jgi:hypothetical protein
VQKKRRILRIASSEEQGVLFYLKDLLIVQRRIKQMKKHLRVLAAILVLCFSLLCPAASAASVQTAACKPSTAAVQTISAGKKTEQMVWVPTHGGKKYHSKSTCSNMKDPEKVTLSKAKAEGFTACKKCY